METAEFNNCLFIMPLDHPFELTADYQNQTAQILSRKYQFKVLAYRAYESQIRPWKLFQKTNRKKLFEISPQGNILLVSPVHIIPFERFQFIYEINKKISFVLWVLAAQIYFRKIQTTLWIFHPRFFWTVSSSSIIFAKKRVVYDCLDYLSSIKKKEESLLRTGEKYLFKKSDLVVFNSQFLANFHKKNISDGLVSPSGFVVPTQLLEKEKKTEEVPNIGFGGSINYRIDFDLITEVCKKLPNFQFKFYGESYTAEEDDLLDVKKKMETFFKLKNVELVQFTPREKLYKQMVSWDVGIIPYNLKVPLNYYCKPLKLYEYFYFGLPVVSVPIPSIRQYSDVVYLAESANDWIQAIQEAVKNKQTSHQLSYKKNEALNNSWEKKIEFILKKMK
ncbi:MAG: hypothetical protein ABI425_02900 [Patescibacteria group bacterium]